MVTENTMLKKKMEYCTKITSLCRKYKKIAVVSSTNVTANQMLKIRADLSDEAEIVFGKNSLMRRAIEQVKSEIPGIAGIEKHLYNGAGLIFTNGNLKKIKDVIDANCAGSAAKVGAIAPCDVILKPIRTSMSPNDIKILHALNIQCKIFKGTIEITGEKQLIYEGQKVGASEANILNILGIMPFQYTLKINALYDSGNMYDPAILAINEDAIAEKFARGLSNVASASLAIGYPCAASAQHIVGNAFKNVSAIAIAIDHNMKQIEQIQKLLADPDALAAAYKAISGANNGPNTNNDAHEEEEEAIAMEADFASIFDF